MNYFTVYIGGERRDRPNTQEDWANVDRAMTLHQYGYYTRLIKKDTCLGQLERILKCLVSISYIQGEENLNAVLEIIKEAGVTAYSVVCHGNDKECLDEMTFTDKLFAS